MCFGSSSVAVSRAPVTRGMHWTGILQRMLTSSGEVGCPDVDRFCGRRTRTIYGGQWAVVIDHRVVKAMDL